MVCWHYSDDDYDDDDDDNVEFEKHFFNFVNIDIFHIVSQV